MNDLPVPDISEFFDHAPCRMSVDLGAIVTNWRTMARLSRSAEASAVLKANAYGLDAPRVGAALARAGCRSFFVATAEEGVQLRAHVRDGHIYVLSGMWPGTEASFRDARLIPVINSPEQLSDYTASGLSAPYALFVDTGMNRLGFEAEDAVRAVGEMAERPVLLISHLACSDERKHPLNRRQLESFQEVRRQCGNIDSSLSSSAGILLGEDYHFQMTRPGIALYGGQPVPAGPPVELSTVVRAEARVLQIRDVVAGDAVSYGAACRFDRNGRVAIIAAGYADGVSRSLSGHGVPLRQTICRGGQVFASGRMLPVVGRITMDLSMVDISDCPADAVKTGSYVELLGADIPLEAAAEAAGTISYEILTGLGRRFVRRFIGE